MSSYIEAGFKLISSYSGDNEDIICETYKGIGLEILRVVTRADNHIHVVTIYMTNIFLDSLILEDIRVMDVNIVMWAHYYGIHYTVEHIIIPDQSGLPYKSMISINGYGSQLVCSDSLRYYMDIDDDAIR